MCSTGTGVDALAVTAFLLSSGPEGHRRPSSTKDRMDSPTMMWSITLFYQQVIERLAP